MNARDYIRLPDQKWYLRHPEHKIHHSYAAINHRPASPKNIFKQETCMACYTVEEVRHIKVGSMALLCCESCEDKLYLLIELIREKSRKAMREVKNGAIQGSLYDVS